MSSASAPPPPERLVLHGYLPGLDVLRGLAIASVLVFHGFATAGYQGSGQIFIQLANLGQLGIGLFFVLSGFLITSILLKGRDRPDYYRGFYLRRALRILPAYLLLLIVLKAFGLVHWRFIVACLLFIANMAKLVGSSANEYGVLWTLAVEEQFYLLWPALVRMLRRPRVLVTVVLLGCGLAPLFRIAFSLRGSSSYLLLPAHMDALLYGALCAVLIAGGTIHNGNLRRIRRVLLGAGLVFLAPYVYWTVSPAAHGLLFRAVWEGFARFDPYCFFVAGVLFSVENTHRAPGRTAGAFMFLGYISYGLYLVHPLLFMLYDHLFQGGFPAQFPTRFSALALRFVLAVAASVAVAALSRRYYESFFLGLGKPAPTRAGEAIATGTLP